MITLDGVRRRAELDAAARGYRLNPNPMFLQDLLEGLRENEGRYGYPSCPCRIAVDRFELDRDIICPCDYRDPDVMEHGACYCSLFVDAKTYESKETRPIPERRPVEKQVRAYGLAGEGFVEPERAPLTTVKSAEAGRKLLYCRQCGYVVFSEEPPYVCPICRAKREMFAEITGRLELQSTL